MVFGGLVLLRRPSSGGGVTALSQGTAEFGPNVNNGGEAAKGEAARRCIFWSEIWRQPARDAMEPDS
jgi:hypothetical protein